MAQDRISSLFFEMPSAAIDFGKAEFFGSPSQIARALEVLDEQWAAQCIIEAKQAMLCLQTDRWLAAPRAALL
jgi:hypothetical protein